MIGFTFEKLPCKFNYLSQYGNSSGDIYGHYVGYFNGYYWFDN